MRALIGAMTESERAMLQSLLRDWFGTLGPRGEVAPEVIERWWSKDPGFDSFLRQMYGSWVSKAIGGELEHFEAQLEPWLGYLLLLDQLPRNIYRDTPEMYAGDARAVASALQGIELGRHLALPEIQQVFVLMPLMHSEQLPHQERVVLEFEALLARAAPALQPGLSSNLDFARAHRDIVARFGRFPHRNHTLGRQSTPEEIEFLATPGSSF